MNYGTKQMKKVGQLEVIATGVSMDLLASFILCAIMAWMIRKGSLQQNSIGYAGMVIPAVSVFLGSLTALKIGSEVKIQAIGISALGYYGILVLVSFAVFRSGIEGVIPTGLMVLSGAGAAFLLCNSGQRGGKRSKLRF